MNSSNPINNFYDEVWRKCFISLIYLSLNDTEYVFKYWYQYRNRPLFINLPVVRYPTRRLDIMKTNTETSGHGKRLITDSIFIEYTISWSQDVAVRTTYMKQNTTWNVVQYTLYHVNGRQTLLMFVIDISWIEKLYQIYSVIACNIMNRSYSYILLSCTLCAFTKM